MLAGGEGTRLRPLTRTIPKPVVPLAGRPHLAWMLDWLEYHGVREVLLLCGFLAERVRTRIGERHGRMRLTYVVEPEPLDTAGPLRLALDQGLLADRFFVLNGDILTDLDLAALASHHDVRRARATIALVEVDDARSYGCVPIDEQGRVQAFLEKMENPPTNLVNGGVYLLERGVVAERVPAGRRVSFEREVFPALVGQGLFGYPASCYWLDIGTLERYLEANRDLLAGKPAPPLGGRGLANPLIDGGAEVAGVVTAGSVVEAGCVIASGARVERSVVLGGARLERGAQVLDSVVAESAVIGCEARVGPGAIVGAGAEVAAKAVVGTGARIEPGARVAEASLATGASER
ncbi:nucleotidyltransferase family protein [Thermoleophilum album]|uniref:Mannose-1-phosphate guanylyltransferase n=1 Tax=Thermoleophilum album TaxID=29539 RepID=A0A1H6FHG5_THEAL|nr:NDP-sugar synthase [Thermoleophilum album]SEH10256.1 mannose-1-phosphate guanylyltransferase [Thermoleophilum album]